MIASPDPTARRDQPQSVLGAPAPDTPAAPPRKRAPLTAILGELAEPAQLVTSLVVLAGAGLYATIRFGQQVFYTRFDVRPEEVGQTYAASVSRAAVTIMTVGSVILFWTAGAAVIGRINQRISEERGDPPGKTMAVVATLHGALVGAAAVYLFYQLGGRWLLLASVLTYGVIFSPMLWTTARKVSARFGRDISLPVRAVTGTFREPVGILAGLAMLLCGLLVLSGLAAARTAASVKDGNGVSADSGFGILGLRAEPVLVIGELPENLELSNRAVMFLGQADGTVILYDWFSDETIRAPADGIAVFPGSYEVEHISLRPEQDLDLDVWDGVSPAGETDPFEVEFSWRGNKLLVGSQLASTSSVRAGIADDALTPSRNACTRLQASIQQLDMAKDLRPGLRLCVHTDQNRWVFVTVTDTQAFPPRVTLATVAWPA